MADGEVKELKNWSDTELSQKRIELEARRGKLGDVEFNLACDIAAEEKLRIRMRSQSGRTGDRFMVDRGGSFLEISDDEDTPRHRC